MARANFRLEMNYAGVGHVLKHNKDVQEAIQEVAEAGKNQAKRNSKDEKAEYSVKTFVGADRYRAHIGTKNPEAMHEERENRSLSRLLGGGWL